MGLGAACNLVKCSQMLVFLVSLLGLTAVSTSSKFIIVLNISNFHMTVAVMMPVATLPGLPCFELFSALMCYQCMSC